ncbi:MAG TPA: NADH-quinone oxidoreductase subunit NuoE [Kiritimatiellia bacterium]|nr:NADH-quinone oxidoreductase subunit NuoE [Kiritimatiellia bacterium]HRZ11371.1 NADH-quinone oxidoreductase subunit NuoE [Kiritimatiellia bacterium]HSA17078.1 NADH-quinone oxidoreductase subunit NuoE [Kiritimatiellia bacterium]
MSQEIQADADLRAADIEAVIVPFRGRNGMLIPLLQKMQERFGYVPPESIGPIAKALDVFPVEIYGILTFYAQFCLEPRGRHTIRVCQGTACYIMGGKDLLDHVQGKLGIQVEQTTPDRRFTLERVACLGCCGMAPVVMVDNDFYGRCTPAKMDEVLELYK